MTLPNREPYDGVNFNEGIAESWERGNEGKSSPDGPAHSHPDLRAGANCNLKFAQRKEASKDHEDI